MAAYAEESRMKQRYREKVDIIVNVDPYTLGIHHVVALDVVDKLLGPNSYQNYTHEGQSSTEEEFKEEIDEIKTSRRLRHIGRSNGLPFTTTDHGTFLGIQIPDRDKIPPLDNPVTVSLHSCKQKVFQPYLRLLRTLGWRPLIPEDSGPVWWKRAINIFYLVFVLLLILVAYILQYAACFRRDSAISRSVVTMIPINPMNTTAPVTAESPALIDCQHNVISQYIIPDLLHSAAYIYSFILLRIADNEELVVLMETVFLRSSATHSGYLSQSRLIRNLRWLLFLGVGWLVLSFATMVLDIIATSKSFTFTWMEPMSPTAHYILMGLMLLGFLALNVVYLALVVSYCVQCSLLIFYIRGLQEKIREKSIDLQQAIKEISETAKYLKILNSNTSSAVSLVVFNFATLVVLGFISFMQGKENDYTSFMFFTTALDIVSWLIALAAPLIQAGRLSETCNSLKKLGHEIRVRPFGYQDTSQLDLDSFLLFTSGLNMRAKIFRIPVRSYHIMTIVVFLCFVILLLFQTGALKIWL